MWLDNSFIFLLEQLNYRTLQFDLFYLQRSKGDDCYLVDLYSSIDDTAVLLAGSYGEDG